MRRLQTKDFMEVWEMTKPFIDVRLKPNVDRAIKTYRETLSSTGNFAMCEVDDDGKITGAILVCGGHSAYADKGFCTVELWLGSTALLEAAIEWWEGRPLLRFMGLQFPCDQRPGMYRYLKSRGFERCGDVNMLWR